MRECWTDRGIVSVQIYCGIYSHSSAFCVLKKDKLYLDCIVIIVCEYKESRLTNDITHALTAILDVA